LATLKRIEVSELTELHRSEKKKVTVADFARMKREKKPIVMVTSYDYATAAIADGVGVDSILVGDSYGMVVLGYDTTIPVTMDELIPVCKAVRRGSSRALLIGDMPFMSFQVSPEQAVANAGRFIKEGGVETVKVEGGKRVAPMVEAITQAGIPVLGHIGVTPQTATLQGGYRVQGKSVEDAERLVQDAVALERAGAFGIVLEMVAEEAAKLVTDRVSIPTIGIGSGRNCDGQVLVLHDVLGLYERFTPKFAKRYANLAGQIRDAVGAYTQEVRDRSFPREEHVFRMDDEQRAKLESRRKS
jgi:3-methyl-2-oxobutanoate hydroxymethyltransferase